ncbi:ABC transporter permease [Amycolatopsis endophytica]|uniref:ABC-type nitrate/sulfonate/bicarbonate transport system permease component n=1 Tax=Amycolatopsis endophytica TaxID=860233 RepID=A0A853BE76_9PSEU|nr:ABC transporter permease [Amycolatopsis endophytica]NYI92756.1 ABC-type nitrate/sulfonate/bicarbonate transport system permease component [Amycolatopsis endophytica]
MTETSLSGVAVDARPDRRRARAARRTALRIAEAVLIPAVLIVVWIWTSTSNLTDPLFVPSPGQVWNSFVALEPRLGSAITSTVLTTLAGFAVGTGAGVGIGLLLAYSRHTRSLLGGIFDALRPIPIFALIPLFILWFGLGRTPQIILVAFGTFVVLVVTTLEAIRNVPPVYVKAALNLGASRGFIYRTVVVPSITPHLIGAVRVSAAASWGLGVAAEFIGAQNGLGYLIINRQNYLDTAGIVVLVVVYAIIAYLVDLLIRLGQGRLLRWTDRGSAASSVSSVLGAA